MQLDPPRPNLEYVTYPFFAVFGVISLRIAAHLLGRPWAEALIIISSSQVTLGPLLRMQVASLAGYARGPAGRSEPATFATGLDLKQFRLTMPAVRSVRAGGCSQAACLAAAAKVQSPPRLKQSSPLTQQQYCVRTRDAQPMQKEQDVKQQYLQRK